MKYTFKYFFAAVLLSVALWSCDKKEINAYYPNGILPSLSSSANAVAAAPSDSLSNIITFSWTDPKYATNPSTEKYVIQMDSSGRNFSKAVSFTVMGQLSQTFTAKQINDVLLGFGFAFNVTYNVDVRLISSFANNNEQHTSNVLTLPMTPYKIPPKVPVPQNLYIVGDAISAAPGTGWSNPVDTPYQKLTQLDSVTFGGIFNMTGGNSYLLLPLNGNWDHKYSVADNSLPGLGAGGSFDKDLPKNIPAPASSGWYKLIVNFQTGTFSCTPYSGPTLPLAVTPSPSSLSTGLWIVGDATPGGWTNTPVNLASQQFTQLSNADFQLKVALNSGGSYLFLPAAGDWNNKYACANTGSQPPYGGAFGLNASSNFPGPSSSGNYLIDVNFLTGTYTLTSQ